MNSPIFLDKTIQLAQCSQRCLAPALILFDNLRTFCLSPGLYLGCSHIGKNAWHAAIEALCDMKQGHDKRPPCQLIWPCINSTCRIIHELKWFLGLLVMDKRAIGLLFAKIWLSMALTPSSPCTSDISRSRHTAQVERCMALFIVQIFEAE